MINELVQEIIRIGKLLWDKNLVTGFNGNISARINENEFLITASGTCLGFLKSADIVQMKTDGQVPAGVKASSERLMHASIYKHFPKINAVVHTHTSFTNGFFMAADIFEPRTFEAKFYLGQVRSLAQTTPSVTDVEPLIKELSSNNIVVLGNHGVVAVGTDLFNGFVLIQELEEQIRTDAVRRLYAQGADKHKNQLASGSSSQDQRRYQLFSKEQIDEIVRLVNSDAQMKELGAKSQMNMDLAVCLKETGAVYSFKFQQGQIVETGNDSKAEFLITADEKIWRAVFNREIDPFVATTQKKMSLQGDFARISKWYAPCSRIFQLWAEVPVA